MGYTTDFEGEFQLDRPLSEKHRVYLEKFNETRRMKRKVTLTRKRSDPVRIAAQLPVGTEGAYFVGETGWAGQDHNEDIVDYNNPPKGQPGLWCQWAPTKDGEAISWDGGEKFYSYVEWLEYIIEHFLKRWGYTLNGTVTWQGEDRGDLGKIVVKNNKVKVQTASIVYQDDDE